MFKTLGRVCLSERITDSRGRWWGGGAQGRSHLDTNLQLRLVGPISSFQGRERPQQVERFAPNAVMSRALYRVRAGPRRKAVSSHPYGGLAGRKVVLIPDRGVSQGMKRGTTV